MFLYIHYTSIIQEVPVFCIQGLTLPIQGIIIQPVFFFMNVNKDLGHSDTCSETERNPDIPFLRPYFNQSTGPEGE